MQNLKHNWKKSNQREIEAALIIYHEHPAQYVAELAALTSIGRFRLVPEATQMIHDRYFDTPDEGLRKRRLALRLRKVDDTQLITLKGDSKPTGWGGHNRMEIEQSWSPNALVTILDEIKKRKIQLSQLDNKWECSNSVQVLEKIGLEVIQQRNTQRIIRSIVSQQDNVSMVLAEMAIDTFAYQFKHRMVQLHEVEIESKIAEGAAVVKKVVLTLMKKYEAILKTWSHSKLATGKAIEKLLAEGTLELLVDDFNNLKPMGYDKIDSYIRSDHINM